MKQSDKPGRPANPCTRIGAFRDIAAQTGKREVPGDCGATLFAADDMIDRKSESGVGLMDEAILAEALRPFDDKAAQSN